MTAKTLGPLVADWMEANLVHGPGDIEGEPYSLDDEQLAFLCRVYLLRDDGRRQFRRAVLSRRKGRAKTELGAAIACAELLGPVRFGGWDDDGEPIGVPVVSPDIPCVATSEDQADLLYGAARVMLTRSPTLSMEVDAGNERINIVNRPGKMYLVTSKSSSRDGARPTFTPCDETHLWVTPELKRLHATLSRNLGKRRASDPWMLETTTAYRPGEESVAEGSHQYGVKVQAGEVHDPRLLFDHLAASMLHDVETDEGLEQAILEASGLAAPWTNVEAIMDEFRDPQFDEADSRRFWLNQVVVAADQWLDPMLWAACASGEVVEDGELVTLGFDGSMFDDSTALVGCRVRDGHLFPLGIWEKPLGREGDGWQVPKLEVDAAVADAMGRFTVWRMYVDPPYWQEELDQWRGQWSETVDDWWTNRERQMALALERLHTAVAKKEVTHDGNPALARHMANARKDERRAGTLIRKPKRVSPMKIDAAMAATLAFEARGDAIAAGALKPKKRGRLVAF